MNSEELIEEEVARRMTVPRMEHIDLHSLEGVMTAAEIEKYKDVPEAFRRVLFEVSKLEQVTNRLTVGIVEINRQLRQVEAAIIRETIQREKAKSQVWKWVLATIGSAFIGAASNQMANLIK